MGPITLVEYIPVYNQEIHRTESGPKRVNVTRGHRKHSIRYDESQIRHLIKRARRWMLSKKANIAFPPRHIRLALAVYQKLDPRSFAINAEAGRMLESEIGSLVVKDAIKFEEEA